MDSEASRPPMKFPQLLGLIVAVHAGLIGILFFQPGCRTTEEAAPAPQSSLPQTQDTTASRSTPTQSTTAQNQPRQQVDPAFNANLPGSGGGASSSNAGLYPPTRPERSSTPGSTASTSSSYNRSSTSRSTSNEPVLQPLNPEVDRSSSSSSSTASSAPDTESRVYVVKRGDSLSRIAKQQGTTVAALRAANNLKGDTIFPDQELYIPDEGSTVSNVPSQAQRSHANESKPQLANGQEYTIQKGDSLSRIASKFGTTITAIKRANNLNSNMIRAGDKLVIPGAGGSSSASASSSRATTSSSSSSSSSSSTRLQPQSSEPLILGGSSSTSGSGSTTSSSSDEDTLNELEFDDLPPVQVETQDEGDSNN